jgi:MFS family permease
MLPLAILLAVHDRFHSFAVAGLAVGAFSFGIAAAAPTLGSLVDRKGPSVVLPTALAAFVLASSALIAAVLLDAPRGPIVICAAMSGAVVPPVSATIRTMWMEAIPDDRTRTQAFALDATVTQALFALGPLFTSAVVLVASPAAAIVTSAIVAALGTALLIRSSLLRQVEGQRALRRYSESANAKRDRALRSKGLRFVLVGVFLVGAAGGTMEVGLPALSIHFGSRAASGISLGVWALGGALGGWIFGARSWRAPLPVRYRTAALVAAVFTLPLLAAPSLALAIALSAAAGLPQAPVYACQYGLVGITAPGASLTEAFMWMVAAIVAGAAAGSAVGGVVIAAVGVRACLALPALALAAVAVVPISLPTSAAVPSSAAGDVSSRQVM